MINDKVYTIPNSEVVPIYNRLDYYTPEVNQFNNAEYLAQIESEKVQAAFNMKEKLINERTNKTKEYIKQYKDLMKKKEETQQIMKDHKKQIKANQAEFNKQIRTKVLAKSKTTDPLNIKPKTIIVSTGSNKIDLTDSKYYDDKHSKNPLSYIEEEEPLPNNIQETLNNQTNSNIKYSESKLKVTYQNGTHNDLSNTNVFKNNYLETNKQLTNYERSNEKTTIEKKENIKDPLTSIKYGIETIKDFRKRGIVNNYNKEIEEDTEDFPSQLKVKPTPEKCEIEKKKQFKNELEKRRYVKALKNLMIDKFSEKNIIIPNICSCGQLQKKLDILLEKGNINVLSIINTECANNCIYYNNSKGYQKALSDIISSVKNLKFESFLK